MGEDLRSSGVGLRGFKSHPPHRACSSDPSLIFPIGAGSTNKIKIYSYDRIFNTAIKRLQSAADICNNDKTSIIKMVETLLAKGVGKQRAVKYINHLTVLARMTGKPFDQLGKDDVQKLVIWINTANYTEHTKHDYRVILKKFYQWLRGCDEEEHEYPEEVRWIKTNFKSKRLLPEALLTMKEIKKLAEIAENPRDRALILTHYESGCRIGETLSLRILSVHFDQYGAVLIVDGKTGPRRVRVIAATPALASWLSIHPLRSDPNAPLWIGLGTVGRYQPLGYSAARALFRRIAKKAGLNKRLYSHLMRHTRATELANILTEAQMKEFFGWVQSSDMPAVYVHLSGRDVDVALLKAHGIASNQEEKVKAELTSTLCPRCKRKAGPEDQFCPNCGMILDVKAALKLEHERVRADQIMDMLMKDDEVKELLARKVRELYFSPQPPPKSQATP
jgi:integrase/recombinase XerD